MLAQLTTRTAPARPAPGRKAIQLLQQLESPPRVHTVSDALSVRYALLVSVSQTAA
jgi:hypothetical protein